MTNGMIYTNPFGKFYIINMEKENSEKNLKKTPQNNKKCGVFSKLFNLNSFDLLMLKWTLYPTEYLMNNIKSNTHHPHHHTNRRHHHSCNCICSDSRSYTFHKDSPNPVFSHSICRYDKVISGI